MEKIAVVIPCFRVKAKILDVIQRVPASISYIIIVDDQCPENSGTWVKENCRDPRLTVVHHPENQGVGGAMVTGYRTALELGASVIVKIDGDGQMAPELIPRFVDPILAGRADYTKGNRFFRRQFLSGMPLIRLFGNMSLSFVTKVVTGYWQLMDPTNGYTAIHARVLSEILTDPLEKRYFFETDMLFRLSALRAVVMDVPMRAVYADERSSLSVRRVLMTWPLKYSQRFLKRLAYNYVLRDFNFGSIAGIVGAVLLFWGTGFGLERWYYFSTHGLAAPSGTVMLAALPILAGIQLVLSALNYDMKNVPHVPIHPFLTSGDEPVSADSNLTSSRARS